jgi:S1-C subfamily serine protease
MIAWKTALVAAAVALLLPLFVTVARADVPLGLVVQDTSAGVVVVDVIPGRVADRCMPRLRRGARIVSVNGAPVKSAEQFVEVVVSSDFMRFQFIDPTGELRWAKAWSRDWLLFGCRP